MVNSEELDKNKKQEANPAIDATQKALEKMAEGTMTSEERKQGEGRSATFEAGEQAAEKSQENLKAKPEAKKEFDPKTERAGIETRRNEREDELNKITKQVFGDRPVDIQHLGRVFNSAFDKKYIVSTESGAAVRKIRDDFNESRLTDEEKFAVRRMEKQEEIRNDAEQESKDLWMREVEEARKSPPDFGSAEKIIDKI